MTRCAWRINEIIGVNVTCIVVSRATVHVHGRNGGVEAQFCMRSATRKNSVKNIKLKNKDKFS